jgi:hypothetical protein
MKSAKSLVLAFGIMFATLLGDASSAQAQYGYPPPPPPRGFYRSSGSALAEVRSARRRARYVAAVSQASSTSAAW